MRRQQLRRAVKRVFMGQIGGGDWVESKLTCSSILKPLPTVAGGNLPTFGVMIPQESGIKEGGSINDNWPKRPRKYL